MLVRGNHYAKYVEFTFATRRDHFTNLRRHGLWDNPGGEISLSERVSAWVICDGSGYANLHNQISQYFATRRDHFTSIHHFL